MATGDPRPHLRLDGAGGCRSANLRPSRCHCQGTAPGAFALGVQPVDLLRQAYIPGGNAAQIMG
jgi:hypothetical protein